MQRYGTSGQSSGLRVLGVISLAALLASAVPGGADEAPQRARWTVSFHGGWSGQESAKPQSVNPLGDRGPVFALASGGPSRVVSSWYFGDGAALLNQVAAAFSAASGTSAAPIVPLESALSRVTAGRASGYGGGFRLGRAFVRGTTLELSVDHQRTPLDLGEDARAALKDTSASFIAAFGGLLGTAPASAVDVKSNLENPAHAGGQTKAAVTLRAPLFGSTKLGLFVLAGLGVAVSGGASPKSTLSGRYSFNYLGVSPMSETDSVSVRLFAPRVSPLARLGAGMMFELSRNSGMRVDVRMDFVSSRIEARVSATPAVAAGASPAVLSTAAGIAPGLQFSTQPGARSTLSGPALDLMAFSNSGTRRQSSITVGFYRRF